MLKNNSIYLSNIDHLFLLNNESISSLQDFQCNIIDDIANTSDHRAISVDFKLKIYKNSPIIEPKSNNFHLNLDIKEIKEFFSSLMNIKLDYLISHYTNFDIYQQNDYQLFIDNLYQEFCETIQESANQALLFQANHSSNPKQANIPKKNKSWFTNELKELKNEIVYLRQIDSNESNYKADQLRKKFRRIQRQNIYLAEAKELNKLENLAKNKDKNKFWLFIKKNRNRRKIEKQISIPAKKLIDHYTKFFSANEDHLTETQANISLSVKALFNEYTIPKKDNLKLFTINNLETIFKEMDTSYVKGYDSLSYYLLKNCPQDKLLNFLLFFYNSFIRLNCVPKLLNISIIKPIIKDQNKKADDMNNIRPISISNCLAQIFEKLILINSPELNKMHNNQFGFKQKTSCNHAIFTMKETVLNYTENKSGVKIASLDAEKAFDKVWRDGLFFKLSSKMHITLWVLLKKYYDMSHGTILLPDLNFSALFEIETGVKQGGILSPFLFNDFIDELIILCVDANKGAIFDELNVSIIVYADDILLISPLDSDLQFLLDICSKYSSDWRLKFNASKSNIISFGEQFCLERSFLLNGLPLTPSDTIEYLGVEINSNFDFDSTSINKFKKVQKSIFSLSFIGLKPYGISPLLQSFI